MRRDRPGPRTQAGSSGIRATERALEAMRRAVDFGLVRPIDLTDEEFDRVRDDPEFRRLIAVVQFRL